MTYAPLYDGSVLWTVMFVPLGVVALLVLGRMLAPKDGAGRRRPGIGDSQSFRFSRQDCDSGLPAAELSEKDEDL